MIGKRLGQYEVIAKLGEGGMGEVFHARDTRLGREVALKFLQPAFAADSERLARFRNEAKVLASLNHPNIGAIHGLEEADGHSFLAMEYVAGEDVSARIDAAPLPLDEALELARQFAEGLEVAHELGITHRDLKPSNLRLTPEGQLKILDFGLARSEDALDTGDILNSPTMTVAYTREGVIMGTAAYMSPEQARGRKVDQRSDVWSFGVILYEMITGQRLFSGETVSDTMAAVLRADLDLAELPGDTPAGVRRLLQRCLERDVRRRLRHIGEARVRLERWRDDPASLHESTLLESGAGPVAGRGNAVPWLVAGLALVVAAWFGFTGRSHETPPPRHTEWVLELEVEQDIPRTRNNIVLSPDGNWLAILTADGIRLRRVDSIDVTLMPETATTESACFSPDSRWIAFVNRGGVYRVSVAGGAPFRVGDSDLTRGITWVDETTLVFTDGIATGLTVLDLESGQTRRITAPDSTRNERSHRWPSAVPGKRGVLFEVQLLGRDYDASDVDYVDLDSGERRTIMRGGATPVARASGLLLFTRGNSLYAVGLDPGSLKVTGLPFAVRDGVATAVGNQEDDDGSAQFAVDGLGNLLYLDLMGARTEDLRLAWLDFATGELDVISDYGNFGWGQISPDGRKLAVVRRDDDWNIFVRDLVSGNEQTLTSRESVEYLGAWSPDSRVLYWSQGAESGESFDVWSRPVDGSLPPTFVVSPASKGGAWANAVTPDGGTLAVAVFNGPDRFDLTTVDLTSESKSTRLLVGGPRSQRDMAFDDTGRYFFYVEGAQYYREDAAQGGELLLRRYPDTGAVWTMPQPSDALDAWIWSASESAIIACHLEGVYRMPVDLSGDTPTIGLPELLLDLRTYPQAEQIALWFLHPDGKRAIVSMAESRSSDGPLPSLVYVTGWEDTVLRRLDEAGR